MCTFEGIIEARGRGDFLTRERPIHEQQPEAALREELVRHYRRLQALGLTELASGNLSCRFGDGMLISPAGATAESIKPDSIVATSLDGDWQGGRKPSSEWPMHAAVYRRHPSAHAVVHTHSDHCVALACQRRPLPGFHYLVGTFGGTDVPCVPYSTFGSAALAEDAAQALANRTACLLGSHGMIACGRTLDEAAMYAHRLEILCRQYLLACQLGEPKPLTDEQWADFFAKARHYG